MNLGSPGADLLGGPETAALRVLSLHERSLSGREVARQAGENPSSVRRALGRLVRVGLVEASASSHAVLYRLQREHVLWPPLEQILTARDAVRSAVVGLVTARVEQEVTVAVFGSVARGDADADSDIDLVLVCPDHLGAEQRDELVDALTRTLEMITGNSVQIMTLGPVDLTRMVRTGDPLVASWEVDAVTWTGQDLLAQIRQVRRSQVHGS